MKCNKLFRDSVRAIDFRYKLDDTVNDLLDNQPNAKMTKDQLLGYLAGKGVTASEITASGIKNWLEGFYRSRGGKSASITELKNMLDGAGHYLNLEKSTEFSDYTFRVEGKAPSSNYEARLFTTTYDEGIKQPHFSSDTSILGWNRVHTGTDSTGKDYLMLNELQSDWSQRGKNKEVYSGFDNFPMSEEKFHQLAIVDAIDEAINRGLDEIRIPIERTKNNLEGTHGVTKFYNSLGNKTLPEIKRKLSKEGLDISISKVGSIPDRYIYISNEIDKNEVSNQLARLKESVNTFEDPDVLEEQADDLINYIANFTDSNLPIKIYHDMVDTLMEAAQDTIDRNENVLDNFMQSLYSDGIKVGDDNKMWQIKINTDLRAKTIRPKWNIYSILPTLGITKYQYDKMKKEEPSK